MKIGIIFHSQTGNTNSVARALAEKLQAGGHSVKLEQVSAVNDEQTDAGKIQLKTVPDVNAYDALIFAAPVRGLSLSPVMTVYLSQVDGLQGKKVSCFMTQYFPYPWMGGNRSIEQMKKICEAKGAAVLGTGIVNWSRKDRQRRIADMVEKLGGLF